MKSLKKRMRFTNNKVHNFDVDILSDDSHDALLLFVVCTSPNFAEHHNQTDVLNELRTAVYAVSSLTQTHSLTHSLILTHIHSFAPHSLTISLTHPLTHS